MNAIFAKSSRFKLVLGAFICLAGIIVCLALLSACTAQGSGSITPSGNNVESQTPTIVIASATQIPEVVQTVAPTPDAAATQQAVQEQQAAEATAAQLATDTAATQAAATATEAAAATAAAQPQFEITGLPQSVAEAPIIVGDAWSTSYNSMRQAVLDHFNSLGISPPEFSVQEGQVGVSIEPCDITTINATLTSIDTLFMWQPDPNIQTLLPVWAWVYQSGTGEPEVLFFGVDDSYLSGLGEEANLVEGVLERLRDEERTRVNIRICDNVDVGTTNPHAPLIDDLLRILGSGFSRIVRDLWDGDLSTQQQTALLDRLPAYNKQCPLPALRIIVRPP
ncbi:MAG: hypothetical protein A2Z49_10090 [Chloroflexi bacterium RBG_19FT_COMBO_56_12]|nr:MAG: hypothetical protein A2Z49_10090 [Chloroflexi bacterium RBG_19FT_COMBO_56_12]